MQYTYSNEEKFQFCDDLREVLKGIPSSDKIILLGDFNFIARVNGSDHRVWKKVLGGQGVGKCNTNGKLLLTLCAELTYVLRTLSFVWLISIRHLGCTHALSTGIL